MSIDINSSFTFASEQTHPTRTGNSSRDTEHRQESEAENATFTDNLLGHHDAPDYGTTSTLTHCRSPSPSEDSADSHRTLSNSNTDSVTLRTVLKSKRVQLVIINYFFVCFTEMCYVVLLPLIYSTSIETGGLGLNPYQIGLTMGIWGFFNAIIQINVVGKVIRKYGGASVYKFAYLSYFMGFLTFPFSTHLARRNGSVGIGSCIVIGFQLFFIIFAYMSYGSHSLLSPNEICADLVVCRSIDPSRCRGCRSQTSDRVRQRHRTNGGLHHAHPRSDYCFLPVFVFYSRADSWRVLSLCGALYHFPVWYLLQQGFGQRRKIRIVYLVTFVPALGFPY